MGATSVGEPATSGASRLIKGRRLSSDRWLPPLLLSPSLLALLVFVYGFIAINIYVSFSSWGSLLINLQPRDPLFQTYSEMFAMTRFQCDLRNTVVFTVLFLSLSVGGGLLLAVLLDRHIAGHAFFRNVFLFPYSLSFVVAGVVWRWIFNPDNGVNAIFEITGINHQLAQLGVGPLKPLWATDPRVFLSVNEALAQIFPTANDLQMQIGIPLAIIPVVIAASWQESGFTMAMYIAGLGTISNEVREAALLDGAGGWRTFRYVLLPLLKPFTVTALIIVGHVSLRIFDLIFSMTGVGPGFATDVPGIFVYEQTFRAARYNLGAAASTVMLVLVCLVIVPYLTRTLRED